MHVAQALKVRGTCNQCCNSFSALFLDIVWINVILAISGLYEAAHFFCFAYSFFLAISLPLDDSDVNRIFLTQCSQTKDKIHCNHTAHILATVWNKLCEVLRQMVPQSWCSISSETWDFWLKLMFGPLYWSLLWFMASPEGRGGPTASLWTSYYSTMSITLPHWSSTLHNPSTPASKAPLSVNLVL